MRRIYLTTLGGRPKPEHCFLSGRSCLRSAIRRVTWPWIEHSTLQLEAGHNTI